MTQTRWAIVGTGHIANRFATGMQVVKDAVLAAVVSRKEDSGKKFAEKYGCGHVYTDFGAMLRMERPDIVYLGIPNDCHYEYIMEALDNGVSVLSEKPMVDNGRQLDAVLKKAEEKNLFLMEGMWTRCFPVVRKAREWMKQGKIGEPMSVNAAFNIKPAREEWQVWKGGIAHAGGSLRDVGIYSLAMAYLAFPEGPEKIYSVMNFNGEVDDSFQMLLGYPGGKTASLGGAFNQVGNSRAEIVGSEGRIVIGPQFWSPRKAELILNDGSVEVFEDDYPSSGFQYEVEAVQECLRKGEKQCADFTHEESRRIGELIERTRREWGIVYEADKTC